MRICKRIGLFIKRAVRRNYAVFYRERGESEWRVYGRYWTYVAAQGDYWDLVYTSWNELSIELIKLHGPVFDTFVCRSHCAGAPKGFSSP